MICKNTKTILNEMLKICIMVLIASIIAYSCYYILVKAVLIDVYIRNLSYVVVFLLFVSLLYFLRLIATISRFASDLLKDRKTIHRRYRGELLYVTYEKKFLRTRYKLFIKDHRGYEQEFYSEQNIYAEIKDTIQVLYGPRSYYVFKVVDENIKEEIKKDY